MDDKISKFIKLVASILMMAIVLSGCGIGNANTKGFGMLEEQIDKFAAENNITVLEMESKKDSAVIAYKGSNEYGLMIVSPDDSKDGIGYTKGSFDANRELNKIEFIQLADENEAYLGIFIFDDGLKEKEADIYVEFKDNEPNEPHAIQVSIAKRDAIIIPYKKKYDIREIKRIDLIDKSGSEIYSKVIQ